MLPVQFMFLIIPSFQIYGLSDNSYKNLCMNLFNQLYLCEINAFWSLSALKD